MKWLAALLLVAACSQPATLSNAEAQHLVVEIAESFGIEAPVVGWGHPDLCERGATGCRGGFYIPWQHTIALGDNPLLSTVLHESAHAVIAKLDDSHRHHHDEHFNSTLEEVQLRFPDD